MLDLPYRLLGLLAAGSYRLSRMRVNAIPLNWWVIGLLGLFAGITGGFALEAHRNRAGARQASIRDVLGGPDMTGTFVLVRGTLHLDQVVAEEGKEDDDDAPAWVPLTDGVAQRAVYVKIVPSELAAGDLAEHAVRGTVRPVPSELRKFVGTAGPMVDGVPVDGTLMIVATDRPGSVWTLGSIAALLALAALALVAVFAMRYVVFRPTGDPSPLDTRPAVAPAGTTREGGEGGPDLSDLRVSGVFSLGEKVRERFHRVATALGAADNGDRAFLANVDASVSFMGAKTQDRSGIWLVAMRAGTLAPPQYGRLYWGWTPRPALRLRFTDATSGKAAKAIASFDSETSRNALLAALLRPVEPRKEPTVASPDAPVAPDSAAPPAVEAPAVPAARPQFGLGEPPRAS